MPIIFRLSLKPSRPWQPSTKQAHGLACRFLEDGADSHAAQIKRFALWPILTDRDGLMLHCSWLSDDPPPADVGCLKTVRLGNVHSRVTQCTVDKISFAELAGGSPRTSGTLVFHSPTYFSRNSRCLLTPDPGLILGSYVRRWNDANPAGSPLHVDDVMRRELVKAAELTSYRLSTAEVDSGHDRPQAGFVGSATLRLAGGAGTEMATLLAALIRFASFAGTGAQTTYGFGATTSDLYTPGDG